MSDKNIDIYYIGYITKKYIGDYEGVYSVNHLYFIINKGYKYTEEKNGSKYLILTSTEKTKKYWQIHRTFGWD